MQKHDYVSGTRVYFIRRCSEQTSLMSEVETGTYESDQPGWALEPHLRIRPDRPDCKTVSVPIGRVWPLSGSGRASASDYVRSIKARQERALKRMREKLEASEWKLRQIDKILEEIPDPDAEILN